MVLRLNLKHFLLNKFIFVLVNFYWISYMHVLVTKKNLYACRIWEGQYMHIDHLKRKWGKKKKKNVQLINGSVPLMVCSIDSLNVAIWPMSDFLTKQYYIYLFMTCIVNAFMGISLFRNNDDFSLKKQKDYGH